MRDRIRMTLAAAVAAAALLTGGQALAAEGATIDGGPRGTTTDATPTFTFSAAEPDTTFECRVDAAGALASAWAACSSPYTLALPDGDHVFFVRATDAAGNVDETPATRAFTVDTGGVDTQITAGPAGLTNDPTPSFTFGTETTGAVYECRVDGAATPLPGYADCSSPLTLPELGSGAYTLQVRARTPQGKRDATPASRAFTVDRDAPDTAIASGPSDGGQTGERRPTLTFTAEAGATFECRLDNRARNGVDTADWTACAGGRWTLPELEGGSHRVEVRAVDPAGNVDPSPAERSFTVRVCESVVRFGLIEAEGECLAQVGTADAPKWESDGDVKLNGLFLPAPGPAKVVLHGPTPDRKGGSLSVQDATLTLAGVTFWRGNLAWELPEGGAGEEKTLKEIDLSGAGQQLFGMKVEGSVKLRLRRPANAGGAYKSVFALHVALPEAFKSGPSPGAGSVTGDVAINVDRQGVQLDGLKVAVTNAYVGNLGIKYVCLSFVRAGASVVAPCEAPRIGPGNPAPYVECSTNNEQDRWDGAVAVVLPTASKTELGLWGGLRGGRLSHAGAYVDNLGTLVPLAPGVFLQSVRVGVCVDPKPFMIKGGVGVSFGPDFNGKQAVRVDGDFLYRDAHEGRPWMIRAEGRLTMFDQQVASSYLQYEDSGMLDFGFNGRLGFGPAYVEGKVDGWLETKLGAGAARRFNIDGSVTVCVDAAACAGGRAVISSVGAAGCVWVTMVEVPVLVKDKDWVWWAPWRVHWEMQPVRLEGGAGYTWQSQQVDLMVASCSVDRWVLARPAQAGAVPQTVEIAPDTPMVTVRLHGRGAPPKATLVGPDGRRVAVPERPGGELVRDSHMIASNPADDTTSILVAKPAAGTWRIEPDPGSAPITAVDKANALAEPTVSGGVGGRGHRRTLGYAHSPQRGEKVTLVERGPKTQKTLGVASGGRCRQAPGGVRAGRAVRCGTLRFSPGAGPAGRRQILAVIEQDGRPRETQVVASYIAPATRRPGRVRLLRAARRKSDAIVRWAGATGARTINLEVRVSDGRRVLHVRSAKAGALRVRGVSVRHRLTVVARSLRQDGVQSRPVTTTLRNTRRSLAVKPRVKAPRTRKDSR